MDSSKLLFFPYSWHVRDSEIHVYGFDQQSCPLLVRLTDFTPYVYVKLPNYIDWSPTNVSRLVQVLKKNGKIHKSSLIFKRPLYFANVSLDHTTQNLKHELHPYLFLAFENERERKNFAYNTRKKQTVMGIGNIEFEIYEHNASAVLQLTCLRNISTADWFYVKNPKPATETISRLKQEYSVNWKSVSPLPEGQTMNRLPEPLIMSWDIECSFNNPNKFSDGSQPNDVVFQISCVFGRQSQPKDKWEKYLLTLGNPDPKLLPGIKILSFKKEFQLLLGFNDLVIEKNPQLLIGYNIFKFDIPFMFKRAIAQRIQDDFVRHGCTRDKCKLETIKWSSSAYSNQEMNFIDLQGRMTIDVFTLIQRDFNLETYKLDAVAEKFLGANKDPLNHHDIFMCYELGMKESKHGVSKSMALVGKYCVKDSLLVLELFEKFQYWYSLTEMAKICQVPHSHLFLYGQQLKVFSQVYKYCYQNNIVVESGRFKTAEDDFCTGACVLTPKPGLYDNVVSFDFCLTGDTLVSMNNGSSRRIDSLILNEKVLGFKGNGLQSFYTKNGLQVKGLRDTIKLYFQDGQTLTCTPDHKIMDSVGNWIRADHTLNKLVKIGLQYPEDRTCPLEKTWTLYISNSEWKMTEYRQEILALCRVFGYLVGYLSGKTHDLSSIFLDTCVDAEQFYSDVEYLAGYEAVIQTCRVDLPKTLLNMFLQLDSDYVFLHESNCPTSVIREFLAGFFGYYFPAQRQSGLEQHQVWFQPLLERFGITHYKNIFCYHKPEQQKFMKYIGLRYCATELVYIQSDGRAKKLQIQDKFIPCWNTGIVKIEPNGLQPVFDIEVDDAHCFVANGTVVSNCSLYPSIIISHNIDFTTLVPDDSKIEDEHCRVIEWEEHINCKCPNTTVSKDKNDVRCKNYRYKWLKNIPGVLPTIIRNLLEARKKVRKQMKEMDSKSLEYDILNKRQLAYKVSSNSMYGALSTKKGYLPFLPAGMCVTAVGRQSIEKVSHVIQHEHNGHVVYGDSVLGNTPILLRNSITKEILIQPIETLVHTLDWKPYRGFKLFDSCIRYNKEYGTSHYEVWSDKGWSPIRKVIRHKTHKQIYKVRTRSGLVYVTEDHSLLNEKGQKLKPREAKIGTPLLHVWPFPIKSNYTSPESLSKDKAFIFGYSFHQTGFFPEQLLNGSEKVQRGFLDGYCSRVQSGFVIQQNNTRRINIRGLLNAQRMYYILRKLKYHVRFTEELELFTLWFSTESFREPNYTILECIPVDFVDGSQFVYDLETECGHFQAGVGQMIVKNTDSNYVVFPHLNNLKDIWEHSVRVSDEVSKYFPEPMRLEFEENIYARYLILSKKRYLYFSTNAEGKMSNKIENKGVLLKRRDNSKVIRDIYEQMIRMVLNRYPETDLITKLLEFINMIFSCVIQPEDFSMSKSVKGIEQFNMSYRDARTIQYGDYVVPRLKENSEERASQLLEKGTQNEEQFYQSHLPGAVQLALRMRARGQHIESGSRLSYIITRRSDAKSNVSEKMEEIDYFKMNYSKQMIDVFHYLHLLINPIEEVLIVMYGKKYKNFIKDIYKFRIKYNGVVDQMYRLFHPVYYENNPHASMNESVHTSKQLRITDMFNMFTTTPKSKKTTTRKPKTKE
jgi:DNA polymerase elongation subunit (family B)